ncbi:MAG: hypothetical protein ACK559_33525 [bacterium]
MTGQPGHGGDVEGPAAALCVAAAGGVPCGGLEQPGSGEVAVEAAGVERGAPDRLNAVPGV